MDDATCREYETLRSRLAALDEQRRFVMDRMDVLRAYAGASEARACAEKMKAMSDKSKHETVEDFLAQLAAVKSWLPPAASMLLQAAAEHILILALAPPKCDRCGDTRLALHALHRHRKQYAEAMTKCTYKGSAWRYNRDFVELLDELIALIALDDGAPAEAAG